MRQKKWLCREDFGVLGTIKREVSCRRKPQSPSPYTSRRGGGRGGEGGWVEGGGCCLNQTEETIE